MLKIFVVFLLTVGFTATGVFGQTVDEAAGKADAFLSQLDKPDLPGGAVGVVRDGRLIYKRAFGLANLDYDVPNTTTTLFNLASERVSN